MLSEIEGLDDPQKLRSLLENAQQTGAKEVAAAALKRLIGVRSEKIPGSIKHDFWKTIYAFEEILSQERGKTIRLARTRQKVERVGVKRTLIDFVTSPKPAEGFGMLIECGLSELTAEAIVLRHAASFDPVVRTAAKKRLIFAGANLEEIQQRQSSHSKRKFKRVPGLGRPSFGQTLTPDAAKFNAPRHFGESVEASVGRDDSEILPVSQPNFRRVKARRNKA